MLKNLLIAVLTFSLTGCGAGKLVGTPPVLDSDNYATVNIARPSGYAGCGVRMTIQIDYTDFYWLACGECLSFKVPSGKPITISQTSSTQPDHIEIEPEKGRNYFLENDCNGWACWLHEATQSKYKNVARGCKEHITVPN